jgi:hypothetical protein
MNEVPQIISTVGEACTVISGWFGWKNDLVGSQITLPFAVPQAIQTVNRRLGRLWLEDRHARGNVNIFDSQDTLISPHRYEARPDGVVPIIWENQGVWACGFKPETSTRLWVTGDWPDDQSGASAWRPTQDVVDTAIIFVMLANAIWASADCQMDEEEKPAGVGRLVWTFAPWAGFSGFWTNNDQTLMYAGIGLGRHCAPVRWSSGKAAILTIFHPTSVVGPSRRNPPVACMSALRGRPDPPEIGQNRRD